MTAPNYDALKKRRAGNRGGFGWKAKENGNKVRILPPHSKYIGNWDQMTDLALTFHMHYFRVEGRQTEVSRCLEELKQPCPACAMYRAHKKSSDPGLEELAKSVRSADQFLFNILDINNLQAGIQAWGANYTCWDKIMEIAANPAWGCVVDPANGVNFDVTMTPGQRSRTGHNQYSVTPGDGGQRTTVMSILESIEDWQAKLDVLDEHITPPKTPEEIVALLDEMGFPPPAGKPPRGGGAPAPVAAAVRTAPVAPVTGAPVALSIPGASPAAAPAPVPIAPSAPVPVGAPLPVQAPPAQEGGSRPNLRLVPSERTVTAPHYDPGPDYVPKVSDAERPAGAPRCFGDYAPAVHRCQPCPVLVDCQFKLLGIA